MSPRGAVLISPIVLKNSALPCYSATPIGGIVPLTHQDSSSFPPPGAFGPYRVMHQIGVGVLGPVFRTYDPDDDRLVALKAFHLEITPEQASILAAALQRVVQVGLAHPAIVTPIVAGLSDGVPYLALEYVAAASLDVASRHYAPAAAGTALPFVVQLAEAIDTAHAAGLTHGALHPRDVFVTADLARVTGFGVVSALDAVTLRGPLRRPYTAPEQIAGADWGPAADRFALAAIAYELLTGKRLAGAGKQVTDRLAEVSGVRDRTSLSRLFAGALAETPETRPPSARQFADELADVVGWPGAAAVRQALVRTDGDARDPDHQVVEAASVITVAGVSAHPPVGDEATGTEEATRDMDKFSGSKSTPESQLDWTERKLDRGESDELREPEAYRPRPPGTRAGGESGGAADGLDATERVLRPVRAGGARPRDGAAPLSGAGSLFEQPDDPAEAGGAEVRVELAGEPGDDDFDDTGDRDDKGYSDQDDRGDTGDHGDNDDAELSVVQARYRAVAPSSQPPSRDPESQAAGVYPVITLSGLQDRPDDAAGRSEQNSDNVDADDHLDYDDNGGNDDDGETDATDGAWGAGHEARDDREPADQTLMFESGIIDDDADDPYGDDEDDYQEGLFAAGWAEARGRPVVASVAVALVVVAFVVGFRWVAGGGGVVTDEPSAADVVVAGGLAAPADAAAGESAPSTDPEPPAPQEFSEATVAAAPVETVSAPPTSPPTVLVPEEPEVLEPASPPAPVAAPEAAVASESVTPSVLGAAPATGRLLVRSTPPAVRVLVNGEVRGRTPLALADLSYGAYDVQFVLEGYESQEHRLTISSDEPIAALSAVLTPSADTRTASLGVGSVFVDTRPRGVEVWLDQQLVGESPMLISNVSMGAHQVEFKHVGYRDWATTIQVGSSAQARVTASLDHVPR